MCIVKLNHKRKAQKDGQLQVGLVISFSLLRKGFSIVLSELGYKVHSSYNNGVELISTLTVNDLPDIIIVDVDKPETGAIEAVAWLKEHYPSVKVIALSMEGVESLIKPVLDAGASGYILKTINPEELKIALKEMVTQGYYFGGTKTSF